MDTCPFVTILSPCSPYPRFLILRIKKRLLKTAEYVLIFI